LDSKSDDNGVVIEAVLGDDLLIVGGRHQTVVPVRDSVDNDKLTRETRTVHIGPPSRHALVRAGVLRGAGCGILLFDVHEAERLLEPWTHFLAGHVQQVVLVKVAQVVMTVRLRPDEGAAGRRRGRRRWRRRADEEVGVPGIVREEVKSQNTMRSGSHAAV
jgi:hypothetical protein